MARRNALSGLVLFLVTFAVFSRVLQAGFVAWDAPLNIYENPHIQGLNAKNLKWMFTTVNYPPRYVPLSWLGWAINYQLGALNPAGFHLVDLLFHATNAVLAFFLIQRLLSLATKTAPDGPPGRPVRYCATAGALLWALHPFRVESVAWAAGRNYVQPFLFLLISVLCYLWSQAAPPEKGGCRFYWLSVVSFAVSLLSYPIGLTLPLVLVVLDFYPLRRFQPGLAGLCGAATCRIWVEKVPYFLLSAVVFAATLVLRAANPVLTQPFNLVEFSVSARAMQALYVWAYYAWKPWLPFHLSPVYTTLVAFDPNTWPFWLNAAFVIGTTSLCVWRRHQWPWALALWVSHLVLLVPMLGLTEHPHFTSDRYGYLAGLVWAVALAAALLKISTQAKARVVGVALVVALAFFWGGLSWGQTRIWRNSVSLFEYMLAELVNDPYQADIHGRLGRVYAEQQKWDLAIQQYRRSLEVTPNPIVLYLLAHALQAQGKFDEALEEYTAALRHKPDAEVHMAAAELHMKRGRGGEAIAHYRAALQMQPRLWPVLNNLAWVLASDPNPANRDGKEAVRLAEQACALAGPREALVVATLAAAYAEAGRFPEAVATAEKADRLAAAANQPDLVATNRQRLELYRAGKPARDDR